MRPTNKSAYLAIRALGLSVHYSSEYGEWRVDYRPTDARRTADSAYYTSDRADALATAAAMASWRAVELPAIAIVTNFGQS